MSANGNDSICLVTSKDPSNPRLGTAFAVHRDEEGTYFLTCQHVVTDVGGPDQTLIDNRPVKPIASGSVGGFDDLAVLRVDGSHDVPVLTMNVSGVAESSITLPGFQSFEGGYMLRPLSGKLGEQTSLGAGQQSTRTVAWDLLIE